MIRASGTPGIEDVAERPVMPVGTEEAAARLEGQAGRKPYAG